jgi:hypothetical protein
MHDRHPSLRGQLSTARFTGGAGLGRSSSQTVTLGAYAQKLGV